MNIVLFFLIFNYIGFFFFLSTLILSLLFSTLIGFRLIFKIKKKETKSSGPQLSEYEKQVQANIVERKKMFELMVSGAKRDYVEAIFLGAPKKRAYVKRIRGSTW